MTMSVDADRRATAEIRVLLDSGSHINAHDEQRAKRGCSIVKLAVARQESSG
jgi:hypothetical protein